ncbi:MAG: hypothetical protein M1383_03230 [Patescibacteria group bacterium]|nr:hypothetical protein [Patescibacteria group bacterium]
MVDSFDQNLAAERHYEIIREVERIRDGLSADVINYYHKDPATEEEEKSQHEGMRKYLKIASERINDLLNGKLY